MSVNDSLALSVDLNDETPLLNVTNKNGHTRSTGKKVKDEFFASGSGMINAEKEDEFTLKRRRSKSFSELLLPHFKEIIPITVRFYFIFSFVKRKLS